MATPEREEDEWGRSSLADRIDDAVDRLDHFRDRPSVAFGGVAAIIAIIVLGWWFGRSPEARQVEELIPQVTLADTVPATTAPGPIVVHVAGAVANPGVYEMVDGQRVIDAIGLAGGAVPDADLDQLNLAGIVADGMQVRVPLVGEVLAPVTVPGSSPTSSGPIDLNRATEADLDLLPGVGPATAAAIVGWRSDNGPFTSVDDLLAVPGIGPAKLAALADLVVVG